MMEIVLRRGPPVFSFGGLIFEARSWKELGDMTCGCGHCQQLVLGYLVQTNCLFYLAEKEGEA